MNIDHSWEKGFFGEEEFTDRLTDTILPWAEKEVIPVSFRSLDGVRLAGHYAVHPDHSKSVTFIHGFGEFYGKYLEVLYLFYQAGYSVFFLELRGHGGSQHLVNDKDLVHVGSFDEYLDDVFSFQDQIVLPNSRGDVHILYAHSMGGCVAALFLERYPGFFDKAILSSPMLELDFGMPDWKVGALAKITGLGAMSTRPAPGARRFDPEPHLAQSSALSEPRYLYQLGLRRKDPHCQTWSATYGWTAASRRAMSEAVARAGQIKCPVLILQAEQDHLVLPGGQRLTAKRAPKASLITIPDSRHEIFNSLPETRHVYWTTIFTFLERPVDLALAPIR